MNNKNKLRIESDHPIESESLILKKNMSLFTYSALIVIYDWKRKGYWVCLLSLCVMKYHLVITIKYGKFKFENSSKVFILLHFFQLVYLDINP